MGGVQTDGHLVTGRSPGGHPAFHGALVDAFVALVALDALDEASWRSWRWVLAS